MYHHTPLVSARVPLIWCFGICLIATAPGFRLVSCRARLCLASEEGIKNKSVWKQKKMKRKVIVLRRGGAVKASSPEHEGRLGVGLSSLTGRAAACDATRLTGCGKGWTLCDRGGTQWKAPPGTWSRRSPGDNSGRDERKARRRAGNVGAQRGKSSHGVNKVPPENKGNEEEGEDLSLNEPVTRHSR